MTDNNNNTLDTEHEINLLELLQVIAKRSGLIVKLCVVTAIVSIIYSLTLPKIYSATAKVLPPQKESGGALSAILGQAGGLGALAGGLTGLGGNADLYMGILKSRTVADAVINRLDLIKVFKSKNIEGARLAFAAGFKIQSGKDGIISITAENRDPKMAALLANAMVEELGRRSVQLNLTKAGTERVFLEKRLELVKEDLKKAEEALRSFQVQNKTIKVDSQATATIAGVAQLKAEIARTEVQLAAARSYQTDESPEVKILQSSLAKLKSQMSGLEGRGGGIDAIPSVGNIPNLGLEYVRLMRNLKVQEAIYEQLTKQYEIVKLNEAKDSSSIQVLDDAVVPLKKSKPKRSIIVILATLSAFFIGIFSAFILEYVEKMPAEDQERWRSILSLLGRNRFAELCRRVSFKPRK